MSFIWIDALQRLRAIAQTGLTYSQDPYDLERYTEIRKIVDRGLVELLKAPPETIADVYSLAKGYPTPKLDVRTAVFVEGQVLLVRETVDGKWGWIFLADLVSGTPTPSLETSEVAFFSLQNLPPLSEGRTRPEDIEDANRARLDQGLPPIID